MPTNMHQEHWCCRHPLSYSNHYCAPDATAMLGTVAEDIALKLLNCHDTSTMSPTPTWRNSSLEKQSDFPNVTQLAKIRTRTHTHVLTKSFALPRVPPSLRISTSNRCQYHVMWSQHLRMSWSFFPTVITYSIKTFGIKNWVHMEVKTFLKIRYGLCVWNMNLILNRIFLITNTIFKQACLYQKLGKCLTGLFIC